MDEIRIKFIEKETKKETGHKFFSYESFGKWYADNYDNIETLEVIQIHD